MPLPKSPRLQQLAIPSNLTVVLVVLLLAALSVIFCLWLVIVPARVALLCPVECECDIGGYYVKCDGPSLTAVPLIRVTDVLVLGFFSNNITLLEKDSFVSLTEMEELSVLECRLRTIELGAFNGLSNLKTLYIYSNEISEIIPGTFENMTSLEYLSFFNNSLEHLNNDVFSGLVKLNYIDLARNKLQELHPDTFLGLPNLQKLRLSDNLPLEIPTDRNFINSHSLLYLDISNCKVSSLSVEIFANVSALEQLDLRDNELMTLDVNILKSLPNLSTLYLSGNRLQCDCQLQEVWQWHKNRDIDTENWRGLLECNTPSEVKGLWWGVLENGQCSGGNIEYYGDYNSTSFVYNGTAPEEFNKYDAEFFQQYQIPVYAIPFIFGTISNAILLIIIICNKDMRTVPNMYILNLAVNDIINLSVLFAEACANAVFGEWLEGDFLCTFLPFCRRMSVGLSAYSVAVYSFQRYRVTVDPFQVLVSSEAKWRVTVATICGVWIVAALFAVPSALSKYMCEAPLLAKSIKYYRLVVIFELLVSCVIPLCVVAFSYIMTARHLVENSRSLTEGTQNPQLKARINAAKTVVGLAFVFLISYVPYHVLWTYITYSEQFLSNKVNDVLDASNYKYQYLYLILTGFLLINSCLNPVALFWSSSPFRRHLKRYFTCFCKTSAPSNDLQLTRRN